MADSGSNEDRLLRSALSKTPECLSIEALAAMNAKARAHVEHCAYCRNELAMLVEFQDATPLPGEAADLAWVQSELKRRSTANPATVPAKSLWDRVNDWIARVFPSRGWRTGPDRRRPGVGSGRRDVHGFWKRNVAGASVRRAGVAFPERFAGVAPLGDVAAPAELHWEAVPGAAKYLVRVMEVDGTEIWRSEAPGTRIALPAGVRGQMTAGRSFLWTITARNENGSTVAESSLQSFHILATSR